MKIEDIQKTVAHDFRVPLADLLGKDRSRRYSYPRMVAMALSREMTTHSLPEIGRLFNRDHTTIMSGLDRVKANKFLRDNADRIKEKLTSRGPRRDWRSRSRDEFQAITAIADGLRSLTWVSPTYFDTRSIPQ